MASEATTDEQTRYPARMRMFADTSADVVWAGLMALDIALQHQLLRELASILAASPAGSRKRSPDKKIEAAIAALYDAYDFLGHSPSNRGYVLLRKDHPELDLPPEGSIRRWLGCGWNEGLQRAFLPTPSDGDFAYQAIEHGFGLQELIDLVLACAADLKKRVSVGEFFAWVKLPAVAERFERRPFTDNAFRNYGGWLPVVDAARRYAAAQGIETFLLSTVPRVYQYADSEVFAALKEVTERLAERIGGRSPRTAEYHAERLVIQDESIAAGYPRALPSVNYISKRFGGWDNALIAAGLEPLGGSGTKSNLPKIRRPPSRTSPWTREDKAEALRRAFDEIGHPFARERFLQWREGKIEEANLTGGSVQIPTAGVIEREFGGWRRACLENIPGYANPRRRWVKRPLSSPDEADLG